MENFLNSQEIEAMSKLGNIAHIFLERLSTIIKSGLATKDIENVFIDYLNKQDLESAFIGYGGYPAALCISINEEIIHGIPKKDKVIKDGDLVSVDLGIKNQGLVVDCARTYSVGKVSKKAIELNRAGSDSLNAGIKEAKVGNTTGDIGYAVQKVAEESGFSVIRSFVGHGVGHKLHLYPEVPNFGNRSKGALLVEGMALAIEPMLAEGGFEVSSLADGWTIKTKDNSLSCHFENTVVITKKGPIILT